MSTQAEYFTTPAGRIVSGSVHKEETKDAEGKPLVVKTGPNAGQPRTQRAFRLAIPKNDPGWPAVEAKILEVAKRGFPAMFDPTTGACIRPDFAFKFIDGDSPVPNKKGNRPCDQVGHPGHWVLRLASGFMADCFTPGGVAPMDPLTIKTGDWVQVQVKIDANGSASQPGVYLNPSKVAFFKPGEEITSSASGVEAFGGVAPAGSEAAPGGTDAFAGTPPAPSGAAAIPQAPAVTPTTQAPPAPAHDYVANPTGVAPPAPPAEAKTYVVQGQPCTREQLLGWGWTEAQIAALP